MVLVPFLTHILSKQGVEPGLAVVDAHGVIGQVTRVHPIQAEITLLTDRNQSIPVSVVRVKGRNGFFYNTLKIGA